MVVVIADAVEQQPILLKTKAVESEGCVSALHGVGNAGYLLLRGHSAGAEANQFSEVAAVQGKVLDSFLRAEIGDRGSFSFQYGAGILNFDCFRGATTASATSAARRCPTSSLT